MTSRRGFLAGLAGAPLVAAAGRRPNTLFILIDDLRFDALGCLGHAWMKTPNIDRLAREGAVFENAFCTTPLCSPSRASFLTGRWVHSHGIVDNTNRSEASHKLLTFPALQQKAGYRTGYVGKWHMGNDPNPRPGFDSWVSFPGQGRYENPLINIDGKTDERKGFMTDILNQHALDFLAGAGNDKPFSLYFAHKAVHGPFTPPERHAKLYDGMAVKRHPNANDTLDDKPALKRNANPQKQNPGLFGPPDETVRNQLRLLSAVDEGIGEIYGALEKSGRLDDTLILFTSDNGYFHGDHGFGDKRAAFDEALRIPMVVRYPKLVKPGTKIAADVLNVDVAPTMLALSGAGAPAEMKGRSMLPVLGGRSKGWRRDFYCEYFFEPNFPRVPGWHAVRTPEWKLVEYKDHPEWAELYDLKGDPYEMKNLAGSAARKRAELAARLAVLERETS